MKKASKGAAGDNDELPPYEEVQRSATEVTSLLCKLGLQCYVGVFADHGLELLDDLRNVTVDELGSLGVKLGHQKRLRRALEGDAPQLSEYATMAGKAPGCCGGGVYRLEDGAVVAESGVLAQPGEVAGLLASSNNWGAAWELHFGGATYVRGSSCGGSMVGAFGRNGEDGMGAAKSGQYLVVAVARGTMAEGPCINAVSTVARALKEKGL